MKNFRLDVKKAMAQNRTTMTSGSNITFASASFMTSESGSVVNLYSPILIPVASASAMPTPNEGTGSLYVKGTDNNLYYQDDHGNEVDLTAGGGSGAPTDAQYVTLAANGSLSNERVLSAGDGMTLTDNGAGSTVILTVTGSTDLGELTGSNILIDGSTSGSINFVNDGVIYIPDNDSTAFSIQEATNQYINFNTTNGSEVIAFLVSPRIRDDIKLNFGNADDAHIEYDEDGSDALIISGSSNNQSLALSGSHISASCETFTILNNNDGGDAKLNFIADRGDDAIEFAHIKQYNGAAFEMKGHYIELAATKANGGVGIPGVAQTTGHVLDITANSLTTGRALRVTSTSTDKSGDSELVKIHSDGDRGDDSNKHVGLLVDFDSTAGTAARALKIDSEQTTGVVFELDADQVTTGTALSISADARTTGTALDISDSNTSDSAGSLVKITQTGNRAGSAASYGLYIDFDTTANTSAKALYIDSEQTTGTVVSVDARQITTGFGISAVFNGRTTGTGLSISDTGTSDSAGSLVKIVQDGDRAGSAASYGLYIDFDTTANAAARALKIDSEQTTGVVFELDADAVTTGTALDITADALTTGGILNLVSDSSDTNARTLVTVKNDNTAAVGTVVMHLVNDAIGGDDDPILLVESTAAETEALLELRNSNAATDKPPILKFNRSDATAEADDMDLGAIKFEGRSTGPVATYAQIVARASDVTQDDEGGLLRFLVMCRGTETSAGQISLLDIGGEDVANSTPCQVVVNESGIDCDFRVESYNNTHMLFVDAGDDTVTIGADDALHKQGFATINDFNGTTFESQLADGEYGSADILRYSPGANDTLTAGQIYFLHTDGTWDSTDADAVATGASQMLGVGLGGSSQTVGVLTKGFIKIPSTEILNLPGSGAVDGLPLYVSTTAGHFDFTAPSATNDFVRIVGYAIDDDSNDVLVYFDPDKTHVVIA